MGELGALGLTRGAGCVEEHDGLVVLAVGDIVHRLVLGEQLEEAVGLDSDAVDPDLLRRLAGLVRQLDLNRLTVVCHDWGGPTGLGFAMSNPERVRALAVMSTWAWPKLPLSSRSVASL